MRDRALFLSALLAGLPQVTVALEGREGIVGSLFYTLFALVQRQKRTILTREGQTSSARLELLERLWLRNQRREDHDRRQPVHRTRFERPGI